MTDQHDRRAELLSSIAATSADIQRWTMQMALNGRVSTDRCSDIRHATKRIADWTDHLLRLS